jgi:vacuolar-type H+-ATPase subunit I/STV1
VDQILDGKASDSVIERVKNAKYDERLSLLGLILDKVSSELRNIYYEAQILEEELEAFKKIKAELDESSEPASKLLANAIAAMRSELDNGKRSNSLSDDRRRILHGTMNAMEAVSKALAQAGDPDGAEAFEIMRKCFNGRRGEYLERVKVMDAELENMFSFAEEVFGDGQEMLIIVTELTKGAYSARYISRHGCKKYFEHNKELLFYERQSEILKEIEGVDI